jgi:hypothetical protein
MHADVLVETSLSAKNREVLNPPELRGIAFDSPLFFLLAIGGSDLS